MDSKNKKKNKHINDRPYTFIEVCAGAGGLSKGFIVAVFKPLLLNDIDKYCIETLKMNHPNINVIKGSMVDLDLEKYKDNNIDVLIGGVPCQPFSQTGKRKGIADDRGKLIIHFIKMISILTPKMFIIENVDGLITYDKGKTLQMVINKINKIGKYIINYSVLNANDYRISAENLQVLHKMCRRSAGINENVHKICGYYRISAENLQVLQKMCRRSAGIAENVQKICRYCRKCAEDLQVLQKMCRRSAGIHQLSCEIARNIVRCLADEAVGQVG